jgi:hypothetical protein
MEDRLAAAGSPVVTRPRLHSVWCLSAVVRAETVRGAAFLKACAPVFQAEPAITAAVARVSPGLAPAVVARDDAEGWLLMRDAGGTVLGDLPPERWGDGLDVLGRVQRAWAASDGAALEDRGPERLARPSRGSWRIDVLDPLPDDTRRLPPFRTCSTRAGGRPPPSPTIVHGVSIPGTSTWATGTRSSTDRTLLGPPFLDLVTYVGRTPDAGARRAMLARYLDGWSAHATRAALEEAARLALPLGALHQVESYRRILASLEPDDRRP